MTYSASGSIARWHSMFLVILPVDEPSHTKQHAATSKLQFVTDHVQFITHQANQTLLIDASNRSAAEVEKSFRAVPKVVASGLEIAWTGAEEFCRKMSEILSNFTCLGVSGC